MHAPAAQPFLCESDRKVGGKWIALAYVREVQHETDGLCLYTWIDSLDFGWLHNSLSAERLQRRLFGAAVTGRYVPGGV
jgi:hypothetical protein